MTVLVCGSRKFSNANLIKKQLKLLKEKNKGPVKLLHGGACGADSFAHQAAIALGLDSQAFLADWTQHGRSAGCIRNQRMLDEGKPDLVLAFRVKGVSPGTDDLIKRAKKLNIPVLLYLEN